MAAITPTTFFMLASPPPMNSTKKQKIFMQQINSSSSKTNGKTDKLSQERSLRIKSHAQPVLNGERTSMIESQEDDDHEIMTSASATMEHLTQAGRLINSGRVFQQNVFIRSFELDPDHYKVSPKSIMNYLQEASVNHRKKMGMSANAPGITPEMSKRDLVWVFRGMIIEVDRYPYWGDVVQVCHWFSTIRRTGLRLDCIINDNKTGQTLVRSSCFAVMMNKITRKTCKLPEEVKEEIKPFLTKYAEPIVEAEKNLSPEVETMDQIRTGLTAGWNDLDSNYHVNNAKYLDWILESTPESLIYSHELSKINLEYRKECLKGDVIQSLSRVVTNGRDENGRIELEHLLRLESGPQVLRARTTWRPKPICRKS